MLNIRHSVHEFVRVQQLPSTAGISDEQLAIYEVVPGRFIGFQEVVQFGRVRRPVPEETDPNRSVHEDQARQAAVFLLPVFCRRLGTSIAPASEPLSFRSLS